MKKNAQKYVLQFEKTYFLYFSFLTGCLALHLKDDLVFGIYFLGVGGVQFCNCMTYGTKLQVWG
jgi:hypothetical protein